MTLFNFVNLSIYTNTEVRMYLVKWVFSVHSGSPSSRLKMGLGIYLKYLKLSALFCISGIR